jgi:hypothetical protein
MPVSTLPPLWPISHHNWMAPGAVKNVTAAYGRGLDIGALRMQGSIWEILWSNTPTRDNPANFAWVPFEPSDPHMLLAANAFRRYGPGWSYGPGHNMHGEVIAYFEEVYGRKPTKMEQMDIEHNRGMWQQLVKLYQDKIGFTPGQPEPEPAKPQPEPPTPKPGPTVDELLGQMEGLLAQLRKALGR